MKAKNIKLKKYELTIGQFLEMENKGLIDFSVIVEKTDIQRQFVWADDKERQLGLIRSIFSGKSTGTIYVVKSPDGLLVVLDGQQRLKTIKTFVANKLKMPKGQSPIYIHEADKDFQLANKHFGDIGNDLTELFMGRNIEIAEFDFEGDHATKSIYSSYENLLQFVFEDHNNGVPLSNMEKYRARLGETLEFIEELTTHSVFKLISGLSSKRFTDQEVALDLLMAETPASNRDEEKGKLGIDLSKEAKKVYIDQAKNWSKPSKATKERMTLKLDYLQKVFEREEYKKEPLKYLRKNQFFMLYLLLPEVMRNGVSEDEFFVWINDLLCKESRKYREANNIYNKYELAMSKGSTTSAKSINVKYGLLKEEFESFLRDFQEEKQA